MMVQVVRRAAPAPTLVPEPALRPNSGIPKIGHPSRRKLYSQATVSAICDALENGTPLAVVCREGRARDADFPLDDAVRAWAKQDQKLAAAIARARDTGYDTIAHRSRKTARGLWPEEGGESTGDIQRDKLIIDTDLKLLKVWDPTRYGDHKSVDMNVNMSLDAMVAESLRPAAPAEHVTVTDVDFSPVDEAEGTAGALRSCAGD